uniref:Uncharacterized protein n=1 Tax=Rhizophora mucronata TaxID=61149 RepID=A0A2P2N573_RHIMU
MDGTIRVRNIIKDFPDFLFLFIPFLLT